MSIQDIETTHSDYARLKRESDLIMVMMDEHELKRQCDASQGGAESYLKKPLSYARPNDKEKEKALYERYLEHAFLPEHIVSDAAEEMTGICFKVAPVINLPDKIKHLEKHANTKGDSLTALAEDVIRDLITSRRAAISTDYIDDRSVIQHKRSSLLINWRKNSSGYTMMVFSESYLDDEGKAQEQRRHYSIEEGFLLVTVYRQVANGRWSEHIEVDDAGDAIAQPTLPNNKPYEYIPVRIAQTVKPALLGMARTVWKGFKISADYFGMLHKLTPTLVIKSDQAAAALSVGFENGVKVGVNDSVELLQQGTDGADPLRVAMEGMYNSAVDQGVRLVSESAKAESGEAIFLRNANKQIKMDSVAREASEQIEEALRVAAILENANPDEVQFKLEVELVEDPVDVANLQELREAVTDGQLVRWADYLLQMQANNLIKLDKLEDGNFDTAAYIELAISEFKAINSASEIV